MRAQMNTKYITSSSREATVTHVMNMMISKLTNADIQSTITPDEAVTCHGMYTTSKLVIQQSNHLLEWTVF